MMTFWPPSLWRLSRVARSHHEQGLAGALQERGDDAAVEEQRQSTAAVAGNGDQVNVFPIGCREDLLLYRPPRIG